jgi:hypothetical protein
MSTFDQHLLNRCSSAIATLEYVMGVAKDTGDADLDHALEAFSARARDFVEGAYALSEKADALGEDEKRELEAGDDKRPWEDDDDDEEEDDRRRQPER